MTEPTGGGWAPANEVERALATAMAAGQAREFFQLIVDADLYLPAFVETDPMARQRFLTVDLFGQQYLPVFTAPASLVRAVGRNIEAYTITTYAELKSKWPSDDWRLAINMGSPIDAYLTVDAVAAAARGELVVPTATELMAQGRAEALVSAAEHGDGEAYLQALLDSEVFVPARRPVRAGELLEADFPWRVTQEPVDRPGPGEPSVRPTIEVVPMPGQTPPNVPGVVVPLTALLIAWPDPAYQLAVASGGRVVTVPGSYLSSLAVTAGADTGVDSDVDGDQPGVVDRPGLGVTYRDPAR